MCIAAFSSPVKLPICLPRSARGLNSGVPDAILVVRAIQKALLAKDRVTAKETIRAAAEERRMAAQQRGGFRWSWFPNSGMKNGTDRMGRT